MSANALTPQDAETARLEAALDRIARAAAPRALATPKESTAIAARLDRLIADLRSLLGTQ